MWTKGFSHRAGYVSYNPAGCKTLAIYTLGNSGKASGEQKNKFFINKELTLSNNLKIHFCIKRSLVSYAK